MPILRKSLQNLLITSSKSKIEGLATTQCLHCGKDLNGKFNKFCSQSCNNSHMKYLEKKMHKAIKEDPNHTQKISQD